MGALGASLGDYSRPFYPQENPNLKASQYTERLSKMWAKHPDNPMNMSR